MFSKRLIGLLLLIACVLFAPPVVADLSIVADLDSNATNGPDSTGIDPGDTVLVRLWITGADSMHAFGITFGDTSGVFEWISDTSSVIYVTPNGWTNTEVRLDTSTGWLLLQATDFGLDAPLHTPCEIARLQFTSDDAGECAEFVGDLSISGWMDTDIDGDTFSTFEAAKVCVKTMRGGGLGPVSGGLSSDADWFVVGGSAGDSLGAAIATAGDLDGDGYSDVVVGAPYWEDGSSNSMGAVYVYLGSDTGL